MIADNDGGWKDTFSGSDGAGYNITNCTFYDNEWHHIKRCCERNKYN